MDPIGNTGAPGNTITPSQRLPQRPPPEPDEEERVRIALQDFAQAATWRNTTAAQWEEIAALIATNYVNTFYYGA